MLQADAKNFELNRNANVQFCFQYLSQCILVLKNLGPSSLSEINSNYKGFYVPDFTQCSTPAQEPNIPISIRKTESYLFKLVVSASDQNPLDNAVKPLSCQMGPSWGHYRGAICHSSNRRGLGTSPFSMG